MSNFWRAVSNNGTTEADNPTNEADTPRSKPDKMTSDPVQTRAEVDFPTIEADGTRAEHDRPPAGVGFPGMAAGWGQRADAGNTQVAGRCVTSAVRSRPRAAGV